MIREESNAGSIPAVSLAPSAIIAEVPEEPEDLVAPRRQPPHCEGDEHDDNEPNRR